MVVRDVIETLKLVADGIRSSREIVAAMKDGKAYLRRKYPQAKDDLKGMMEQMEVTLNGVSTVTSVVTAFRFTVAGSDVDRQPSQFNDYAIEAASRLESLKAERAKLKGSSGKVREHLDRLNALGTDSWTGWLKLLNYPDKGRMEVASAFHMFYGVDEHMIRNVDLLLETTDKALTDVGAALGPPGTSDPANVSKAAAKLAQYAKRFDPITRQSRKLADDVRAMVEDLDA